MEKVIIAGAGPAGLTAAYELLDRSDEYEVLCSRRAARLEEYQEL